MQEVQHMSEHLKRTTATYRERVTNTGSVMATRVGEARSPRREREGIAGVGRVSCIGWERAIDSPATPSE